MANPIVWLPAEMPLAVKRPTSCPDAPLYSSAAPLMGHCPRPALQAEVE